MQRARRTRALPRADRMKDWIADGPPIEQGGLGGRLTQGDPASRMPSRARARAREGSAGSGALRRSWARSPGPPLNLWQVERSAAMGGGPPRFARREVIRGGREGRVPSLLGAPDAPFFAEVPAMGRGRVFLSRGRPAHGPARSGKPRECSFPLSGAEKSVSGLPRGLPRGLFASQAPRRGRLPRAGLLEPLRTREEPFSRPGQDTLAPWARRILAGRKVGAWQAGELIAPSRLQGELGANRRKVRGP